LLVIYQNTLVIIASVGFSNFGCQNYFYKYEYDIFIQYIGVIFKIILVTQNYAVL